MYNAVCNSEKYRLNEVNTMDEAKKLKEIKKNIKEKAESQKVWKALAEPPQGKKEHAEYFNQTIKGRLLPLRTMNRWFSKLFGK